MASFSSIASGTKKLILTHKIWSAIVLLAVIGGGWYGYQALTATSGTTSYVLGTVTQGTVVASVSESGQVSASTQLNVQPQVSGTVTWVGVSPGDTVSAGQALATIDNTTAKQSVASAQASLKTAELQYQQDQAQAPFSYQTDLNNLQTAKDDLTTAYVDAFNTISNTYLDLPAITAGMNDTLYGYELDKAGEQWNVDVLTNTFQNQDRVAVQPFAASAKTDFQAANAKYTPSLSDYQNLTRVSSNQDVDKMLAESIATETAIAQSLQSDLNFLGKVNNLATTDNIKLPTAAATLQTNATNYLATVNADLNALLAMKKTLDTDAQTITDDQNAITLLQVGNTNGDNPISLQVSAANIDQQKQNLQNLEDTLAEYTVVAPFSGTIAAVTAQVGASSGSSLATEITNDQIATLSLNEVDAAKIKLADKVTLTFDAISGLTLTGSVAEIDPVGTVSQGVVSYNVQVDFTSQNPQIKPGVTVNAAIQTSVAQNVLVVPSTAIKTANGASYVQAFTPPLATTGGTQGVVSATAPTMVPVTVGISDNTNVEITSGLTAGQQIVLRTVTTGSNTASAAAAATARTTTTRPGGAAGGLGGGALGGAVRAYNVIEISNITKSYGSGDTAFQALKGISFSIQDGEFVAIMGPSGPENRHSCTSSAALERRPRANISSTKKMFRNFLTKTRRHPQETKSASCSRRSISSPARPYFGTSCSPYLRRRAGRETREERPRKPSSPPGWRKRILLTRSNRAFRRPDTARRDRARPRQRPDVDSRGRTDRKPRYKNRRDRARYVPNVEPRARAHYRPHHP